MAKRPGAKKHQGLEVSISDFKARCLEFINRAYSEGREYVITKRGEPIARLGPLSGTGRSARGSWKGLIQIRGDIVRTDWTEEFEVTKE
ncbi:MAG TPA: type II toxin-antitoxin system prevent-host-death family antitoxin [Acidobacteriota bacterium]|jgi:prevent-host-death family protein